MPKRTPGRTTQRVPANDNPYSEAQFKTLKYRPEFPERFGTVEGARTVCAALFAWYNGEHHHGGIALLTPAMVHYGRATQVIEARQAQLDVAYAAHPQRFVNGAPLHPALPAAVWINPPVVDAVPKGEDTTRLLAAVPSAVTKDKSALRNAEGGRVDRETARANCGKTTAVSGAPGAGASA